MPYIITDSSGDEIVIPDGGLNQEYSIGLVGRNYENYGSIIAKTQIGLLENFSNTAPPPRPTTGQLWYDETANIMRVYDSTNASWTPQTPLVSSGAPSNTYNQIINGFMYFNTELSQLYIYANGAYYRANSPGTVSDAFAGSPEIGNPTVYGTNVRNIYLYDTEGVPRNVFAIVSINNGSGNPNIGSYYQSEQLVAIFSDHDEFTVASSPAAVVEGTVHVYTAQLSELGGIGLTIKPGVNVRKDSTAVTNFAKYSDRTESAYTVNTGTFTYNSSTGVISDNGGITVAGANIYHKGASIVSDSASTYNVGATNIPFAEGYFTDLLIGDNTNGRIVPNGSSLVKIGEPTNRIDELHVNKIFSSSFGSGDLGSLSSRIGDGYFDNLYSNTITVTGNITYPLPYHGSEGQHMVLREDGGEFFASWENPINEINDILEDANKSITISSSPITVEHVTTKINGGQVAYNDVYTNLTLSANVDYIKSQFTGSTYITYNGAGKYTLNYPNPFKSSSDSAAGWDWEPADFVKVENTNQTVQGRKNFSGTLLVSGDLEFDTTLTNNYEMTVASDVLVINTPSGEQVSVNNSGDLNVSGDITAFSASSFSDDRIKENKSVIDNALEKVNELTGYTYDLKDKGVRSAGLIAQDVQKVLPEVVSEHDGILAVSYGNMIGLLVEAIKDLTAEVNNLKEQLDKK